MRPRASAPTTNPRDPWERFEQAVKASGRPSKEAELLTDHELLTLLACPNERDRDHERRIVEREALRRAQDKEAARRLVHELAADPSAGFSGRKRELKEELFTAFEGPGSTRGPPGT